MFARRPASFSGRINRSVKFYFAPMEGLTGYIYRNAHQAFFKSIDKYFSPFIFANQGDRFKTRELKDISPENNQGIVLIPQLLSNNANDFVHTAKKLKSLGYHEINLNLGCPSGTVVAKGRGSGFLARREDLDNFLADIFARAETRISIKTRIGKDRPDEWHALMEIFNKYPIEELIIHPRIQKDFYKNKPDLKIFRDALHTSKNPVCYNGDIFSASDFRAFSAAFPAVNTIMLGRGLITNPGLVSEIKSGAELDKSLLKDFHDKIYEDYKSVLSGERNVLYKMKEIWVYMVLVFTDHEKYAKRILKSDRLRDYEEAVASLFREQAILP